MLLSCLCPKPQVPPALGTRVGCSDVTGAGAISLQPARECRSAASAMCRHAGGAASAPEGWGASGEGDLRGKEVGEFGLGSGTACRGITAPGYRQDGAGEGCEAERGTGAAP